MNDAAFAYGLLASMAIGIGIGLVAPQPGYGVVAWGICTGVVNAAIYYADISGK